jgi:diguanylate cyclase (GGDEF)-like protein/PAS domain S-box-containing protein
MGEERFSASTRSPEAERATITPSIEADRRLYHLVVATIASFCLVVVSGQLKTMAGEIVAVWIADGYLLGHLMAVPRRSKLFILAGGIIGNLAANLMGDENLYVSLSFTAAGMVEVCAAAWLLPRVHSSKELINPRTFLRFVFAAGVLAPLISGFAAVLLLQGVFTTHPFSSFSNWVISASLGLVIFTPVTLNIVSGEWRSLLEPGNRMKSLALLVLVGCATALIFVQTTQSVLYWALPPLALLAFHAELSTVLLGILLFISIAVPLTVRGMGPLWLTPFTDMQQRILALQVFTIAALSVALPITVMQVQRNRLVGLVIDGHRRFRQLAEHSDEVIIQLASSGEFQYLSPRVRHILGYEPRELVGCQLERMVHEDDWWRVRQAMTAATTEHMEESVEYRLRRRDRSFIWVRSFIAAMPAEPTDAYAAMAFTVRDINAQVLSEYRRSAEEEQLKQLAYVDSLTGLGNRRYFDAEFKSYFQPAPGTAAVPELAVLFIDVDFFKKYNDIYGHPAGDECLKTVGNNVKRAIREADLLARYGGEEFVVALSGCSYTEAVEAAERIRANIEGLAVAHEGSPLGALTLSRGVAHTSDAGTVNPGELLELADSALYDAKRLGRNQVFHRRTLEAT